MPYDWKPQEAHTELHLWPHQSLPLRGFVWFIVVTFALLMVPLLPLLGSVILWGVLPFLLLALAGIWFALSRSRHQAQIIEVLTLSDSHAHLRRREPNGATREWGCNRYWIQTRLHKQGGPVPNYVTLRGEGREVEIGAFLSEEERTALYDELSRLLRPN